MLASLTGYCLGVTAKKATKLILYNLSLVIVSLGVLLKLQYILINWEKINKDCSSRWQQVVLELRRNKLTGLVKKLLTHIIPLMGGLSGGLYYGYLSAWELGDRPSALWVCKSYKLRLIGMVGIIKIKMSGDKTIDKMTDTLKGVN